MIYHSDRHGTFYEAMAREMLRYAGFTPSVNAKLIPVSRRGYCYETECRWMDDLYEIYGDQEVM